MTLDELLSRLLDYPDELPSAPPELAALPPVARFLAEARSLGLGALQRHYVETIEFDRRASLYLTYHVHGDRRRRGVELVRLKRRFAEAGFLLDDEELPDYLPVLLEFAALAPEGRTPLAGLRSPLELVRTRLHERGSPYAHLLDALVATLPPLTRAQADTVRRLAADGPPGELVGLEPAMEAAS
jgi:nitrate reductase delta subunit